MRELLSYLPSAPVGDPAAVAAAGAAAVDAGAADPGRFVPAAPRSAYDVRDALRAIVDRDSLLELHPRWARNVVTTLARIDGRPVAIVANQPRYLGGVLDAEGSEKAARFVNFCDSFGLPLIAVVDTPGFMPGSRQEQAGVIRHGASLVRAFAAARVPKLTVVLRKSYGGAYITMNSRDLGADLVLAWPEAELGIMSARAAVGIVNRRELRAADDPEAERDAARRGVRRASTCVPTRRPLPGFVDEIIEPVETRDRLASALESFAGDPDARSLARDPRRQAAADHRRDHEGLDRLPRRRAGAAGGRRGAADELRARQADDRARRRAAAEPVDVLELDVNRAGGPATRSTDDAARALGRGRRGAARDRVRARGRARRQVHDRAGRQRAAGVHDQRVLAQGAGGGASRR